MNQIVFTSFIDADEAEQAVSDLLELGYAQNDINIVVNDRQRRRYMQHTASAAADHNDRTPAVLNAHRGRKVIRSLVAEALPGVERPPDAADRWQSRLLVGGPLVRLVPGDVDALVPAHVFADALMMAGVGRRDAERATDDVSRGGILIAVSARHDDVARAQAALKRRAEPMPGRVDLQYSIAH